MALLHRGVREVEVIKFIEAQSQSNISGDCYFLNGNCKVFLSMARRNFAKSCIVARDVEAI